MLSAVIPCRKRLVGAVPVWRCVLVGERLLRRRVGRRLGLGRGLGVRLGLWGRGLDEAGVVDEDGGGGGLGGLWGEGGGDGGGVGEGDFDVEEEGLALLAGPAGRIGVSLRTRKVLGAPSAKQTSGYLTHSAAMPLGICF